MNADELENCNKPVAWMQMHHKDNVPTKFSPVKVWEDDIPLYTTPQTKPLSDDEINQLSGYHIEIEWFDEGEYGMEYNIYGVKELVRAVEERHGIK